MKKILKRIICWCLVVAMILNVEMTAKAAEEEESLNVLFIGNSHTYFSYVDTGVAATLKAIADANGKKVNTDYIAYDGTFLRTYSAINGGGSHYNELMYRLNSKKWDYVVVQEKVVKLIGRLKGSSYAALRSIKDVVKEVNPETRILLYQTHGYNLKEEIDVWSGIAQLDKKDCSIYVNAANNFLSEMTDIELVPAGAYFGKIEHTYPEMCMRYTDNKHCNKTGYFAVASVFYKTLFGEVPTKYVLSDTLIGPNKIPLGVTELEQSNIYGCLDSSIELSDKMVVLNPGDSKAIDVIKGKGIIWWRSTDDKVAEVVNGKIVAKGKGVAAISAESEDGYIATVYVSVESRKLTQEKIRFSSVNNIVASGKTVKNVPNISDTVKNSCLSYTSSDESIAVVNSNGLVRGVNPGRVTITVTDINNEYSDLYYLYVKLATPTIKKVKSAAKGSKVTNTVTWNSINGAEKYIVYVATKKNGSYKKLEITDVNKYVHKNIKKGVKYYYKVQAANEYSNCKSGESMAVLGYIK